MGLANMEDNGEIIAYASKFELGTKDYRILKMYDQYAVHKVVYSLFNDIRTTDDKKSGKRSGILYVNNGFQRDTMSLVILSTRKPHSTPLLGKLSIKEVSKTFLEYKRYKFNIVVNAYSNNKILHGTDAIDWAKNKIETEAGVAIHGMFIVNTTAQIIQKDKMTITHNMVRLNGVMTIIDKDKFKSAFVNGIGKGKAFGMGFLQVSPF